MNRSLAFVSLIAAAAFAGSCGVSDETNTTSPASDTSGEPSERTEAPSSTTGAADTAGTAPNPTSGPDPATNGTEPTPSVANATSELVVDQRPPTEGERDRLDDDGRGGLLDCDDDRGGAGTWDWNEIGPDDPIGRMSSDALLDAIGETEGLLPESGWTELVFSESDSTFVHSIVNDDWSAIVTVGGEPVAGVWRQFDFYACNPDFTE